MVSESREHITFRKNLLEFDELKIQKLPTFYAAYSFLIRISFKRNYINSKMIQREAEAAENSNTTTSSSTTSTTTASTTSWSRLKDPRIVRVSRAYGGKDRHSKVCTVRGLRDRRVRLSVPTAIQLYDLQERLGLNQPSKVVDWLLNAAKNEIDELPPLQIPQGGFSINPNIDQYHHQHHASQSDGQGLIKNEEGCSRQFNLENTIPISSNFPIYNSFVRWDLSSNTTLSQNSSRNLIGSTGDDDLQNLSLVNPSLGSHHQVFVYQPGLINQQYNNFPSSNSSPPLSLDHHHSNTTQLPVIRPFHFSMNDANLNLPLQDNADNEQN